MAFLSQLFNYSFCSYFSSMKRSSYYAIEGVSPREWSNLRIVFGTFIICVQIIGFTRSQLDHIDASLGQSRCYPIHFHPLSFLYFLPTEVATCSPRLPMFPKCWRSKKVYLDSSGQSSETIFLNLAANTS